MDEPIDQRRRVSAPRAFNFGDGMARDHDKQRAIETFHDGDKQCRLCKCTLSIYNREPYCGPCDLALGPFPSVMSYQEAARRSGRVQNGREAARKREAQRRRKAARQEGTTA